MKSSARAALFVGLATGLVTASQAVSTVVAPADWGSMQTVAADYPSNQLVYEFTVAPEQALTISNTFIASTYAPNSYEAGFVSPGWFYVRRQCTACGTEGNVIWDMGKPYSSNFDTAYTMILIGGAGRGSEVADYQPGATYQSTLTWDRAASKIDISINGPGVSLTRQVDSSNDIITGLVFEGPNYAAMGASAFGNVSVLVGPVPEPASYLLLLAGLVAISHRLHTRRS